MTVFLQCWVQSKFLPEKTSKRATSVLDCVRKDLAVIRHLHEWGGSFITSAHPQVCFAFLLSIVKIVLVHALWEFRHSIQSFSVSTDVPERAIGKCSKCLAFSINALIHFWPAASSQTAFAQSFARAAISNPTAFAQASASASASESWLSSHISLHWSYVNALSRSFPWCSRLIICWQCATISSQYPIFCFKCMHHQVLLFNYPSGVLSQSRECSLLEYVSCVPYAISSSILKSPCIAQQEGYYIFLCNCSLDIYDILAGGGGSSQAYAAALAQAVVQGGSASATAFATAFSSRGGCTTVCWFLSLFLSFLFFQGFPISQQGVMPWHSYLLRTFAHS